MLPSAPAKPIAPTAAAAAGGGGGAVIAAPQPNHTSASPAPTPGTLSKPPSTIGSSFNAGHVPHSNAAAAPMELDSVPPSRDRPSSVSPVPKAPAAGLCEGLLEVHPARAAPSITEEQQQVQHERQLVTPEPMELVEDELDSTLASDLSAHMSRLETVSMDRGRRLHVEGTAVQVRFCRRAFAKLSISPVLLHSIPWRLHLVTGKPWSVMVTDLCCHAGAGWILPRPQLLTQQSKDAIMLPELFCIEANSSGA